MRYQEGVVVGVLSLILVVAAEPDEGLAKKMLPVYQKEAATYSIAVESDPKKALELKKEPVFEWANLARGTTQGVVFLWRATAAPRRSGVSSPTRTPNSRAGWSSTRCTRSTARSSW